MKCLVTGAAGFIGSSLCIAQLEAGHDVVGIDSFSDYYPRRIKEANLGPAFDHDAFRLIEGSLLNLNLVDAFRDVEVIFHLAAQAGVRNSWGNDFQIYSDNNIVATQRVLEACRVTRPRRLVHASSSSVYGDASTMPILEDSPLGPLSPYGVSKLAAEELCLIYKDNFNIGSVILRYFSVYGPRQRPDMAVHKFIRAGIEGVPIQVYGDGNQIRDLTYISDIVAATQAAADLGEEGNAYNISAGSPWHLNDVLKIIEGTLNQPLTVSYLPPQPGDARDAFSNSNKARRELLFAPSVHLQEGIATETEWLTEALAMGVL